MKVLLTGVTGFVGSHILPRLVAEGHSVHAVLRDAARQARPTGASVTFIAGDVVSGAGLDEAVAGCEAIIHLVGIIMEGRDATFEKVHHEGTQNVLTAAKKAGVKRFVQMSALGASPHGVSKYQTSKWRAEEEVRLSGIPHTILRPSIIFGPRDGFVTQMVQVMKAAPIIRPVVGTGKYPFRPIYIDDVVDCFVQALTVPAATGKTIEVGGPDELSLEQMLDTIAQCIGLQKPAVHIPFRLMYANAAILQRILPKPPVTTDQLRMLQQGSTCDITTMLQTFRLQLVDFRSGLNRYLCAG